jgi:hypothetical protein
VWWSLCLVGARAHRPGPCLGPRQPAGANVIANTSLDEGDVVRILRRTVDLLAQVPYAEAVSEQLRTHHPQGPPGDQPVPRLRRSIDLLAQQKTPPEDSATGHTSKPSR